MKLQIFEIVLAKGPSSGVRPPSPILLRCRYAGREKAKITTIPLGRRELD
jgi:hypothetical protein